MGNASARRGVFLGPGTLLQMISFLNGQRETWLTTGPRNSSALDPLSWSHDETLRASRLHAAFFGLT